jgi:hypothetical protein
MNRGGYFLLTEAVIFLLTEAVINNRLEKWIYRGGSKITVFFLIRDPSPKIPSFLETDLL